LASPVQQQELARSAKAEATSAVKIRIIGAEAEGFKKNKLPAMKDAGSFGKLLGGSHVSRLAGSRSAWAAGSGEKSGSGGNEGKFHVLNEFVFGWTMA
jgi:hypothetical protein